MEEIVVKEIWDILPLPTYDEIEELFNSNQFMKNRWEYVRDIIKSNILDFKEIEDIIE